MDLTLDKKELVWEMTKMKIRSFSVVLCDKRERQVFKMTYERFRQFASISGFRS